MADTFDPLDSEHARPRGVDDDTVEAVGVLSEAFEATEDARGHLYAFHRLTGRADSILDRSVALLRRTGNDDLADLVEQELIGRNVLPGRWTFQIVEEYDDDYYTTFKDIERTIRERLLAGRRHVFEAEMKARRRTSGHPSHTAEP